MSTNTVPFLQRARKAVVAAALAAAGAFVTSITAEVPQTSDGWIALVTAAVGIGLAAGWATYRTTNRTV